MSGTARAVAHPNIALAKYWGKLETGHNLPAVPSLSVTLDAMSTTASVGFGPGLETDRVVINGAPAGEAEARRVTELLDRVRDAAGLRTRAWVESANDFATASGLASSASAFAALAVAAVSAAGLDWDSARLSDLARQSSVSAARSLFGGFVTLAAGRPGLAFLAAEPMLEGSDWDIAVSVCVTTQRSKDISSSDGMRHTRDTSRYYSAWLAEAPRLFQRVQGAVWTRDLEALGEAAEESAFSMHACAMAATPAVLYLSPVTLAAIERVRKLRREGTLAYVTMDAGPHVKVLSRGADAETVSAAMRDVPGVERVLVARPGR
ncbi:MAG TPA: diphosphomevalonate decarboxylase, partial [Dongiaceae bacterium]|nr:diphosphomevalonate decarboxylase [Dongiaceae bacterium]